MLVGGSTDTLYLALTIMDEGVYASYCLYGFAPNEDALHLDYPSLVLGGADELLEHLINGKETMSRYQIDYAYSGDICWAYMIDFDTMNFEVYKGFNRNELEPHERFYNGGKKLSSLYPIVMRRSYCLEALPTDEVFLDDLCED